MTSYTITTQSGHLWLIETATSAADALRQYYDGEAEPHADVAVEADEGRMSHLRDMGQAS